MRNSQKRRKLFHWFSRHGAQKGVVFIQETHSTIDSYENWKLIFKGDIIMSHGTNFGKGVAILLGEKLDINTHLKIVDEKGRYIILNVNIQGTEILLINIYQPNDEKGQVETLHEIISEVNKLDLQADTPIIWGGDFNAIFDTNLDASGDNPSLKVKTLEVLDTIMTDLDLCDIWRVRNSSTKRYTWRGTAQGKVSNIQNRLFRRLDYFLVSDTLQPVIEKSEIIVAPATDHSAIMLKFTSLDESQRGPSFWKFNNSLLQDDDYIKLVNDLIDSSVKENCAGNIANPNTLWEIIKYRIRKVTISFSKGKAKRKRSKYAEIEQKIKEIEGKNNWENDGEALAKHDELKSELNEYSKNVMEVLCLDRDVDGMKKVKSAPNIF